MTERTFVGRADPLGHVAVTESHREDGSPVDRCVRLSEGTPISEGEEGCLRSARSIVISARTHVTTGFSLATNSAHSREGGKPASLILGPRVRADDLD